MKKVSIILLFVVYSSFSSILFTTANAQEGIIWKHKTAGMISSSPLVHNGKVYCGSDDSYLYCRNAQTGEAIWSHKADTSLLSNPVVNGDIIFFESGNILYALNANNGVKLWQFNPLNDTLAYKIDPWDYHHSSPVVDDTVVYYGCGNGTLYGIMIATGDVMLQYNTVNHSAIRSTPLVRDGILYFGDWHSRIYALNIETKDTLWTFATVVPIPYEAFGAVVTELVEYNNSLYFGARNNTVRAVDIITGHDKWSIYDPSGSWMPGNPVISDSILYIGGSDNHALWALNANTGKTIWTYPAGQNIFTKPIVFDDFIIIASGVGGTLDIPNPYSKGYLHLINRSNGSLINKFMVNGNIFSSPFIKDGIIYFGSNDSTLYAIDSSYLFRPIPQLTFEKEGSINLGAISDDIVATIILNNTGDIADTLDIDVTSTTSLPEGIIELSGNYLTLAPGQSDSLHITIHPQGFDAKNYYLNVNFHSRESELVQSFKKNQFQDI